MLRLENLTSKYLEIAETSPNTKTALAALQIIESSMRIADKMRMPIRDDFVVAVFLSNVQIVCRRAELYRRFVEFCVESKTPTISKGKFFRQANVFGFEFIERNGTVQAYPPGTFSKERRRISALDNQLKQLT